MAVSENAWFLTAESGNVATKFHINHLAEMSRTSIDKALNGVGLDLRRKARKLVKDPPKTGRLYRIGGRLHRASAPGQPPANFTGKLRKSIGFKVMGGNRLMFGAGAEYAGFLEIGTKKMEPRPYLFRTIEDNGSDAQGRFDEELRKELLQ